eukprot:353267-Chlamydomonas_euryale.AAC.4
MACMHGYTRCLPGEQQDTQQAACGGERGRKCACSGPPGEQEDAQQAHAAEDAQPPQVERLNDGQLPQRRRLQQAAGVDTTCERQHHHIAPATGEAHMLHRHDTLDNGDQQIRRKRLCATWRSHEVRLRRSAPKRLPLPPPHSQCKEALSARLASGKSGKSLGSPPILSAKRALSARTSAAPPCSVQRGLFPLAPRQKAQHIHE